MKVLELKFKNQEDKVVTLSLEAPIEPVNPALITDAMNQIIAGNAFSSSGGDFVEKHSARIVERYVETIEFV